MDELRMVMDEMREREFIAYSRKLLRTLERITKLLDDNEIEEAKQVLRELVEDTRKDIEA